MRGRPYYESMIRTILVVEDDELMRSALARALSEAEFEVSTATNGKEGLETALKTHPDLIITDLLMPEVDGHQMLTELRHDSWGKNARAIILSSDETGASLNKSLEEGVTVYFSKSEANMDELVTQISALG